MALKTIETKAVVTAQDNASPVLRKVGAEFSELEKRAAAAGKRVGAADALAARAAERVGRAQ